MLRRICKLVNQPAFREAPLTVIGRGVAWSFAVLTGRSPVFELVKGGAKLRVPPDLRYTSVSTFLLRDTSEPELRYVQKFVGPGDVFVDVGANIGLFTLKVAPAAARVVAVEPGKEAGEQLDANVALNGFTHVSVVRKALSDQPGRAALFHNPLGHDPQAFSLLNDGHDAESETVELTTLDTLVEQLGLPRLDCVKIDVEGGEGAVIAGGLSALGRFHPTVIFEMNCPTLFRAGGDPAAAWNLLAGLGYRFFQLGKDGQLAPLAARPLEFCNVVARHEASPALRAA
ncbi:FkbM family methyltransferase [Ancylobacter pratisalsi]|uniref:FkbM family methyltransferase n=1 Tax=Ancylobacter pratisalsi TaxID=1745854 RepID=A0A6P1YPS0_9HYPH|nr:FkbM family methyltransferase [Ancylobacter pratisalsi]QIB35438.1 FkbM family methyltransferase [Ancylobacter pratisalsi]